MQITINLGDYVSAGIDRPWIASRGMVESALVSMGFSGFQWQDEDKDGIEAVSAYYNGPMKSYDLPSQVKWVNVKPRQQVQLPTTNPTTVLTQAAERLEPNVMLGMALLEISFTWFLASVLRRKGK